MDADALRRASRAIWDTMAEGWERRHAYFEETARPVTEAMLDSVDLRVGETVLDLAGGTGVVGFAAATAVGSSGQVIVSDFSERMVEAARRHAAAMGLDNVECRVLDAENLALEDDVADVVVCRWGYMLMPDPLAALAESRRVLRQDGRLACAVFAGPRENPWASIPMGVLLERGIVPPPRPGAPGILALADTERLRGLFDAAGFADVRTNEVAFSWSFRDTDEYLRFLIEAAGAIAGILQGLDPDVYDEVRTEIFRQLSSYETDDGRVELPAVAVVSSAS